MTKSTKVTTTTTVVAQPSLEEATSMFSTQNTQVSDLSDTVEEQLGDIFEEQNVSLDVKTVSIDEADYPKAQLKSVPSYPSVLWYAGNLDLVKQGKIVSISMSAPKGSSSRSNSRPNQALVEAVNARHTAICKEACFIASKMGAKGYTVMVESVRRQDLAIVNAALLAGGNVIISTPLNINHKRNAPLHSLFDYILQGRVLVISRTNTESFGKWYPSQGDENHQMMAAFASRSYIVSCLARFQGTHIMALDALKAGKEVFVKNDGSEIHLELINKGVNGHCAKPYSLKPQQD